MNQPQFLIADMAERLFRDLADPHDTVLAEEDGRRAALWQHVEETDLARVWQPERLGGAEAAPAEVLELARVAARSALSVPLVETVIAGWALARGSIAMPDGKGTLAPAGLRDVVALTEDGCLRGSCTRVPFAARVDWLAVLARDGAGGAHVALVEADAATVQPAPSLAHEPAGRIELAGVRPSRIAPVDGGAGPEPALMVAALVRAVQVAGALEAALGMCVGYAGERKAFGRTISRFQAVQHMLAQLAGEAAAASIGARSAASAVHALEAGDTAAALLPVAAAKIRAGEASTAGAAIAHQVYGALGFTAECALHRFTYRTFAWRDEFGSEAEWSRRLGEHLAAAGADAFWPELTRVREVA